MRGGIQKIIWENGMRRFDEVAFIAVLMTFVLLTAELGRAREKNTDENCCPTTPVEQSIVVVTDLSLIHI